MSQQSFKEEFVTNSNTLLADGATVETLAEGQIGILDDKTHLAEATPTYATQKAIKLVWGTPNVTQLTNQGVPNENIYSKLIKGKKIRSFKGIAADPTGTQQIVVLGNSGGASTDDLTAAKGEVKHVYLKLTGGQIDKKFSLQGVTKKYFAVEGLVGEAGSADASALADQLVAAINADADVNRFVTASKITNTGKYGVQVAANQIERETDDATYQFFPAYEKEAVHIQISEFDPNYNNDIDAAVSQWAVTETQAYSPTVGSGKAVRKLEEEALRYHLKHRSHDAVVRAIEGYKFQADPTKFYDEYILEFDFSYKTGGWSEEYTDTYKLHVFFEDGEGAAFETAINGYIATIGLELDAVTL